MNNNEGCASMSVLAKEETAMGQSALFLCKGKMVARVSSTLLMLIVLYGSLQNTYCVSQKEKHYRYIQDVYLMKSLEMFRPSLWRLRHFGFRRVLAQVSQTHIIT